MSFINLMIGQKEITVVKTCTAGVLQLYRQRIFEMPEIRATKFQSNRVIVRGLLCDTHVEHLRSVAKTLAIRWNRPCKEIRGTIWPSASYTSKSEVCMFETAFNLTPKISRSLSGKKESHYKKPGDHSNTTSYSTVQFFAPFVFLVPCITLELVQEVLGCIFKLSNPILNP